MKYLFLDTETTGLPYDYKLSAKNTDNWPRLVSLAYILCDESLDIEEDGYFIIKPVGYKIPSEASDIHGITNDYAIEHGIDINKVLMDISELVSKTDIIVGHNVDFDIKVIDAEFYRRYNEAKIGLKPYICTKEESTDFCALPNNKWPSLQELYKKLFNKEIINAHNAMSDVRAVYECFCKLVDLGVINVKSSPKHSDETRIDVEFCKKCLSILKDEDWAKIGAISYLHTKFLQLEVGESMEDQIAFLTDFVKMRRPRYKELEKVKADIINDCIVALFRTYSDLFPQNLSSKDNILCVTALRTFISAFGKSLTNPEFRKLVIPIYYELVDKYVEKLYGILLGGDFSISASDPSQMTEFIKIREQIKDDVIQKERSVGQYLEDFPNMSKQMLNAMESVQRLNVHNMHFRTLFSEIFAAFQMYVFFMNQVEWVMAKKEDLLVVIQSLEELEQYCSDVDKTNNQKLILTLKEHIPTEKEGCYIATAVYGSYDCEEVLILRRFRDGTLSRSLLGRLFIKIYYFISPKLVKCFGSNVLFKKIFKMILDKLVARFSNSY